MDRHLILVENYDMRYALDRPEFTREFVRQEGSMTLMCLVAGLRDFSRDLRDFGKAIVSIARIASMADRIEIDFAQTRGPNGPQIPCTDG